MDRKQWFEELVREHKATIYNVCYMFSHDNDEVADLFQESLINIWNGSQSYSEQENLKAWMYRIALNTCISLERKRRRRNQVPLQLDVDLFDSEENAWTRQAKLLHDRIGRLQPFDRAIVLLWLEDISYDEIGRIMGISTKNVSVRLYRIKEQLKNMSDN